MSNSIDPFLRRTLVLQSFTQLQVYSSVLIIFRQLTANKTGSALGCLYYFYKV